MSELTKEWLQKTIAELEEERDATPGAVNEDAVMALEAMKIAQASLEAEAVAIVEPSDYVTAAQLVGEEPRSKAVRPLFEGALSFGQKLYAVPRLDNPFCPKCGGTGLADSGGTHPWGEPIYIECDCRSLPPAPVSVPEWTNEQCLEFLSIAFRHAEIKGELELDDIRLGVKMVNGSRAAMLHGADGNPPVIPDGWVACSERLPENKPGSYEYLVFEGLNNRVQHDYWNVPDAGDDCQFTPFWNHYGRYVTHWMPLPAAPQQE